MKKTQRYERRLVEAREDAIGIMEQYNVQRRNLVTAGDGFATD